MNRDERSFRTREIPTDDVYPSFKRTDSWQERRQRSPHPVKEMMGYHDNNNNHQGRHAKLSLHAEYSDHHRKPPPPPPPRPGSTRHDHPNNWSHSEHSRSTTESSSSLTDATHASSSSSTAHDSSGSDRHMTRGRPSQLPQLRENRKSMPPRNESSCELQDNSSEDSGLHRRQSHDQRVPKAELRSSRTPPMSRNGSFSVSELHSSRTPQRSRSGSLSSELNDLPNRNTSRGSAKNWLSSSESHLDSLGVDENKTQTSQSKLHSSMPGIDYMASNQTTHTRPSKHEQSVEDFPIIEESDDNDSSNNLFLFKLSKQLQEFVGPEQITSRYLAELSEKLGMPVAYSCGQGLELVTSDGIVLVSELLKPPQYHAPCTELVRKI